MKPARLIFAALTLITACDRGKAPSAAPPASGSSFPVSGPDSSATPAAVSPKPETTNQKPETRVALPEDFVELVALDPTFVIDVRYATENNFMKQKVYPVAKAYLRREAAEALVRVQARLKPQGLGLKIYDGYRPLSVQRILWKILPDSRYVANPDKGSKHNRGAAVDLTLVDLATGAEREMPTEYDNFTERAGPHDEHCTPAARKNRTALQEAMTAEGFEIIDHEWWHFDYKTWKKYGISDHPIQ